jgi:hypothetical protein
MRYDGIFLRIRKTLRKQFTTQAANSKTPQAKKPTTFLGLRTSFPLFLCRLSDCEPVDYVAEVGSKEMYLLRCNTSLNFGAHIPLKLSPVVKKKVEAWEKKKRSSPGPDSLPISVIVIGVDTTSRSHAFRGMPRVINLMKELGFHDFQAFHALAPYTLSLLSALLMGLTREGVRESCAPTWTSPFDPCPFIWKDLSDHDYVTLYVEDGPQSFNWGQQAGFSEKPTDYYIHALFDAIEELRIRKLPVMITIHSCSMSTMSTLEKLRYSIDLFRSWR